MFIKINGITIPTPARGLVYQGQQLVDSARNANGEVVAQKINRRLIKLDSVTWPLLTDAQWGAILTEINKFTGVLEYYEPSVGARREMDIYWGDYSAEPFRIDPDTGNVLEWINCKCNIIDMGKPRRTVT